jgi:ABC-2 type transport system ATP-binding protein
MILDEPTGGLDPLVQDEFHAIVRELQDAGHTIFLSSHILSEVERICDRVGMIRDGLLVAVERIDDLLAHRLRNLTLTFAEPVDATGFAMLPGVSDLRVDGPRLHCTLTDAAGIDGVVKLAARNRLVDLDIAHPSLEEHFLRYYQNDPSSAASVTESPAEERQ